MKKATRRVLAALLLFITNTAAQAGPAWGPPGWPNGPLDPCSPPNCRIPDPPPKHCRQACENACVPGCDPPDENHAVHGCSSCYSTRNVCRQVCD